MPYPVTETRKTICKSCNNKTSCLYHTFSGLVCGKCTKGKTKGKSPIVPCELCKPPKINWYLEDDDNTKENCGKH